MQHGHKRIGRTLRCLWFGLLAPLALLSGCANLVEQVTSKDFQFKDLFAHHEPVEILRDTNDGAKRAEALLILPEPKVKGGSQQDQELYIKLLTTAATSPKEDYYCRLAAIKSLGRTKDPRAADALKNVYLQDLKYTSEWVNVMRQQTLTALAETKQDVARDLLIRVAKEPPASGDYKEKQETLDRRLAAIRGLGKFNHPDALATLVYLLKTDQDVAVGHRSHESLEMATGKNLPMDPLEVDRELLAGRSPSPPASNPGIQQAQQRIPAKQ